MTEEDLKLQLWCIRNLPTRTKEEVDYYNKCLFCFTGRHNLEYKNFPEKCPKDINPNK